MNVKLCTLLLISLMIIICVKSAQIEDDQKDDLFEIVSMSNPNLASIVTAPGLGEMIATSLLQCAISCGGNTRCNLAVFCQSTNWCKHVYGYEGNPFISLSTDVEMEQSFVLRKKNNNPLCQNGGSFSGQICVCPAGFRGVECEDINPGFCQSSTWREIRDEEYQMLSESYLQMKMVYTTDSTKTIYHVRFFITKDNTGFKLGSFNILSLNESSGDFELPLKRQFIHLSSDLTKLTIVNVEFKEEYVLHQTIIPNANISLLIRDEMDSNRVAYGKYSNGSVLGLIDHLINKGYRLLQRHYIKVGFDKTDGDVYTGGAADHFSSSREYIVHPMYLVCSKLTLRYKKNYFIQRFISTGEQRSNITRSSNKNWELDRCWSKSNSITDIDAMNGKLREIVLSGQEVRLVMGNFMATDVVMITTTKTDTVVAIADYLTPFNGNDPLNSESRIRFSLVSLSKNVAECEMKFEGSTVYSVRKFHYGSTLDWVVSSRPLTKIFVIASNGSILYGSRSFYVSHERTKHQDLCGENANGNCLLWKLGPHTGQRPSCPVPNTCCLRNSPGCGRNVLWSFRNTL